LEKETSFTAEIDNRHLFIGDTNTNQYAILIDWQQPDNRLETFNLTEGDLSYEDFVSRFRQSNNYRGNFTWEELAATGEIDLARLGFSPETIDEQIATINQRSVDLEDGKLFVNIEQFYYGETRNDQILGGFGGEGLLSFGGKDTLEGNSGDDFYFIDVNYSNGSKIYDEDGQDFLLIADRNNLQNLPDDNYFNFHISLSGNPNIFKDSVIELSLPRPGIIGLQKVENDLIIDLNRDGLVQLENDLTISQFFQDSGEAGRGAVEAINNIINTQDIINFFTVIPQVEDFGDNTIYRFYDSNKGVHFYTTDKYERNYVVSKLFNYTYEGASYTAIDPLITEESVAVYRFYNKDTASHLYTIDENERNVVQQELTNFNYEGEVFYAYNIQVEGSIPIYRFYNSTTGSHFYTPSTAERDYVTNDLANFESEGIAYYALPFDSTNV
ncbi:MAG: hypothetical protein ACRC80_34895, partial [Waterburya sp.]